MQALEPPGRVPEPRVPEPQVMALALELLAPEPEQPARASQESRAPEPEWVRASPGRPAH